MKHALVLGAGGFIGNHMVRRLKSEGYKVRGVDLKYPEFSTTEADDFLIADFMLVVFSPQMMVFCSLFSALKRYNLVIYKVP